MLSKAFASRSGPVSAALALAVMCGAAGCQTTENSPVYNEWRPAPLVRASDNGKPAGPPAQGLPLLSRISDPAATRSLVSDGTGQLISSAARHRSTPGPSNEEGVTLNLVNTSIAESARTILGDILGLNYSVNPNLAGKITIQTSTPVSKSDLVELFQNALRSSGATIIRNGDLYQVESGDQFSRSVPEITVGSAGSSGGVVGNSARVVQLKYVAAAEINRILEPMTPKGAIRADDARLRQEAGRWLRELREKRGLSQRELARKVGTENYTFISQLEHGRGRIPPDRYLIWARALAVEPREFVHGLMSYYDPVTYDIIFGGEARLGRSDPRRPIRAIGDPR